MSRTARWARRGLRAGLIACLLGALGYTAALAAALTLPLPDRLQASNSPVVLWHDGTPAHIFLAPDGRWRMPPSHPPAFEDALLRLEDKRFWSHLGVDPIAVLRSAWINLRRGEVVTGASTITMQLVRLLERRPRTLRSKIIEAFRAFQLEQRLSKRRILDEYLRFTPYGRNVEGVTAATWSYFGHDARALTLNEIAVLLAVPQGPSTRAPGGRRTATLRHARDTVGRWLQDHAALPAGTLTGPIPDRVAPPPRRAPHAARWLRRQHQGAQVVRTTLDPQVQTIVERTLAAQAPPLNDVHIANLAVIVVDRQTRAVRALAATPQPDQSAGQVPPFGVQRRLPMVLNHALSRETASPIQVAAAAAGGLTLGDGLRVPAGLPVPRVHAAVGRRDAWAIADRGRWVIVLWLGNLDHQPSPAINAAVTAPVMQGLVEALGGLAR